MNYSPEDEKILRKQEEYIFKSLDATTDFLDRTITTLAVALLGFTITFSNSLFAQGKNTIYLKLCWLFLFLSIISTVIGHMASLLALSSNKKKLVEVFEGRMTYEKASERTNLDKVILFLNFVSPILFVLALISFAIFALY